MIQEGATRSRPPSGKSQGETNQRESPAIFLCEGAITLLLLQPTNPPHEGGRKALEEEEEEKEKEKEKRKEKEKKAKEAAEEEEPQ